MGNLLRLLTGSSNESEQEFLDFESKVSFILIRFKRRFSSLCGGNQIWNLRGFCSFSL